MKASSLTSSSENTYSDTSFSSPENEEGLLSQENQDLGNQECKSSEGNITRVHLELFGNWGHPDKIGLTEVQFYDSSGTLLSLKPVDVSIEGVEDVSMGVENLVNGKTKTVKERHMWSCNFHEGETVTIKFNVPTSIDEQIDSSVCKLSSMKIWNFNKSVKDLCLGVRLAKIMVEEMVVFDGELQKACGNQVFDYGQVIPLNLDHLPHPKMSKCSEMPLKNATLLLSSDVSNPSMKQSLLEGNSEEGLEKSEEDDSVFRNSTIAEWPDSSHRSKTYVSSYTYSSASPGLKMSTYRASGRNFSSIPEQVFKRKGSIERVKNVIRPMSDRSERKPKWLDTKPICEKTENVSTEKPSWLQVSNFND
ncbi:protein KIAA0556-like, partial [Limulus polyphemus]|uniref:Protein KIAA0556-like n=1 Tax=Limulus polyphemus TaxID=6850 RepID=A0ABM1TS61_LIMPO